MSTPLDFTIVSNNDVLIEMTARNLSDDSLVDLTGASVKWDMFRPGSDTVAVTKSTAGSTITILDQTTNRGKFQFYLTPSDTVDLVAGAYPHEAVMVDGDGTAMTLTAGDDALSYGTITLRRQLTPQ